MNTIALLVVTASAALALPNTSSAQARSYPLESPSGLRLHNVTAATAVLDGKKGLRVSISEDALRRLQGMTPEQQARFEQLAAIEGLDFANGVIEVEIAGALAPEAGEGARGFVGIAFRLQNDMQTYDAFYLRPPTGAPRIRSGGIMLLNTSRTPTGRGSGFAGRRRQGTNRTSTWCRGYGRGSGSTCVVNARVSTFTVRNSRR